MHNTHTMAPAEIRMWFAAAGGGGRGGGGAANSNDGKPASTTGTRVKPAGSVGGTRRPGSLPAVPRPGGAANSNAGKPRK